MLLAYVYGDRLKQENGRVWSIDTGMRIAAAHPGAACYVVEVCRSASGTTSASPSRAGTPLPAHRRPPELRAVREHTWPPPGSACVATHSSTVATGSKESAHSGTTTSRDMPPPKRRRRPRSRGPSSGDGGGCCFSSRRSSLNLLGVSALYVAYQRIQLPDALPPIRTSYLLDRKGNQLASLHGAVDRTIVPLTGSRRTCSHAVSPRRMHGSTTIPVSTSAASSARPGPTW